MSEVLAFQLINTSACLVMLFYAAAAAVFIPHRGVWCLRIALCVATALLGFQVASPWMDNTARVAWHTAGLHAVLALGLVRWRREALAFLRAKFAGPEKIDPKTMRRSTDWGKLTH